MTDPIQLLQDPDDEDPMPDPAPDPTEEEMIEAEVRMRQTGPMVYVSREVVRLEREINRLKKEIACHVAQY